MNELLIYRIALGVAGICFAAFAVWTFRLSPENLSRFEPWPRAKLPGMVIGWIALALCVPHAAVVSPGFLVPLLWPLAINAAQMVLESLGTVVALVAGLFMQLALSTYRTAASTAFYVTVSRDPRPEAQEPSVGGDEG